VPGYAARRPLAHRPCAGVSRGMSCGEMRAVSGAGGHVGGQDVVGVVVEAVAALSYRIVVRGSA
jgi:hypothetical protein